MNLIQRLLIFVTFVIIVVGLLIIAGDESTKLASAKPQSFAVNYIWMDSLTTSTTPVDSTFVTVWEQVLLKSTGDTWLKIGAPDIANWATREWYKLESGEALTFGPATKLTRLEWKADAGTVIFFMLGYKTVIQQ